MPAAIIKPISLSLLNEISEFSNEGCGKCLKKILECRNLEKRINRTKGYIRQSNHN